MLQWSHYFSPEQINPFDLNPLRDILLAQVDFEHLRRHSPIRLFLAATHVNSEADAAVLLELACRELDPVETMSCPLSPVIGTHVGPGTVALNYMSGIQ